MKGLMLILLLLLSNMVYAESLQYQDWEIACDNTITCRVAGYQAGNEANSNPVSILITQEACSNVLPSAKVMIKEKDYIVKSLNLIMNDVDYGSIQLNTDDPIGILSKEQLNALIRMLNISANIKFIDKEKNTVWELSNQGAIEALSKMDDIQGKKNTTSSLIKKGIIPYKNICTKHIIPTINIPTIPAVLDTDKKLIDDNRIMIIDLINKAFGDNSICSLINKDSDFLVNRLTDTKLLISTPCWKAPYNAGDAFFIIEDTIPFSPYLITTDGTLYGNGEIFSSIKQKMTGDCWLGETLTWNGNDFILSKRLTTGMCKGFNGGAWNLPIFVSDVRYLP